MDFGAIAHDLRTPLAVMLGHMQMLSREPLSDASRRRLGVIEAQAFRMLRLLDGWSTPARRAGDAALDIALIVGGVLTEVEPELQRRGIDIAARVADSVPPWQGDADLLHRVLLNIVMNAADSIAGHGRIDIDTRLARCASAGEDRVEIEIADSGAGIPDEHIPRVFDSGFTTKPPGTSHGLGLAICREIVEMYGGDIRLTSILGRGTTVCISFPANRERAAATA
jgi:signal transduction histidine kinase